MSMEILHIVSLLAFIGTALSELPHPPEPTTGECSAFEDNDKFDCHPDLTPTEESCHNRGCCWIIQNTKSIGVPTCFYPKNYGGLQLVNISDTAFGKTAYVQRTYRSAYPNDVPLFKIDFRFETQKRLRVKITDPDNDRFEPPIPVVPVVDTAAADTDYEVVLDEAKFGFQVVRKSNREIIHDSQGVGAFIFADQFIQLSAILASKYIYGIGEHRSSLLLSTEWNRFTLFNRDQVPAENSNLYGSHPFYLQVENSGNANGLFLLNSNAMDVILQPKPAITGRTIGGIYDMYFFLGPTPDDVISQYTEVIGRPILPPYWSLGYHQSRFTYPDGLNGTKESWQRTRDAGIPFDVQWNDIDAMQDRNDFTFDSVMYAGLPDFIDELHEIGMHWVPIVDAGVSGSEPAGTYPPYDRGVELGIFVKNSSGLPWTGKVWNPVSTVFPDFTNPKSLDYWSEMLSTMYEFVKFDGLWIDMNEPSNLAETICDNNTLNNPPFVPYVSDGKLYANTVCMDADHYAGKHYDVHNLHGFSEAIVTNNVLSNLLNKRSFIISRASFPGLGYYAGHWSGDNSATWEEMYKSIEEILTFNMYGIPLVGAEICGFIGDPSEELCQRWMQLGSFYTFSRNHNAGTKDQDPAAISTAVAESSRKALLIRYSLLPYLYSLFAGSHANGTTVTRPLFFEFPSDDQTYSIDYEFLWGNELLIVPVLEEGKTEVSAYLPKALWYDYYTLGLVSSGEESVTLSAPLDTIPLLIKGGTIIPTQVPNVTTTESRKNKFGLLVPADENNSARGSLYWDDGDTIGTYEDGSYNWLDFSLQDSQITGTPSYIGYSEPMTLGSVTILGVGSAVSSVSINGEDTPFTYDADVKVLKIENLNVSLTDDLNVMWT